MGKWRRLTKRLISSASLSIKWEVSFKGVGEKPEKSLITRGKNNGLKRGKVTGKSVQAYAPEVGSRGKLKKGHWRLEMKRVSSAQTGGTREGEGTAANIAKRGKGFGNGKTRG